VQGKNTSEWQDQTKHLETLIGREPKSAAEYFREQVSAGGSRRPGGLGTGEEARMNIGIIGAGSSFKPSQSMCRSWGIRSCSASTRGPDTFTPLLKELGPGATARTPQQAAEQSIVILAVMWWNVQAALFLIPIGKAASSWTRPRRCRCRHIGTHLQRDRG
jgi:hypothetical protein